MPVRSLAAVDPRVSTEPAPSQLQGREFPCTRSLQTRNIIMKQANIRASSTSVLLRSCRMKSNSSSNSHSDRRSLSYFIDVHALNNAMTQVMRLLIQRADGYGIGNIGTARMTSAHYNVKDTQGRLYQHQSVTMLSACV